MDKTTTSEKIKIGRHYMDIATKQGYVELRKDIYLVSFSAYLASINKEDHKMIKSFFKDAEFLFEFKNNRKVYITECFAEYNVYDCLEEEENITYGYELPVNYKTRYKGKCYKL